MIQISCPNNNVPERAYAIDALLSDVMGCKHDAYEIHFLDDAKNYELRVDQFKLIIEDHFFNQHLEPLSYLNRGNIPDRVGLFHGLGLEIPIIYGVDKIERGENATVIGLDIFASTFFMLSRWEEFLLGREENGDCDETQLFAVKHGIYNQPVVNEYADLLRKLLPSDIKWSSRKYEVVLSHDVDGFIPPNWMRIAKDVVKQTIYGPPKNKVLNLTWREEIKYRRAFPAYGQFELYTAIAEKYNISEWFYFKVCDKGEIEATYIYDDKQTKEVVDKLRQKENPNLILGFHPSQNMFENKQQWDKELSRITELLQEKPVIGRNHHLLFNHKTLRQWENVTEAPFGISNCVFHKRQGFRSGVCVPYRLFDLYERRVMNLIEHPCQIMDTVIRYDAKIKSNNERWNDVQRVIEEVRKYQGELVLTWHIYIRNKKLIQDYFLWCEKIVHYAVNK